jgi:hypothetical protein
MFQTIPSMPVLALVMPAVNCMDTKLTPLTRSSPQAAFNHECGAPGTAASLSRRAISRQRKRGPPRPDETARAADMPGKRGFTGQIF